jgi:fatty-acyl-CoA synthase
VVVGGSACSASLFDALEELGSQAIQAWGMTEMSPLGSFSVPRASMAHLSAAERRSLRLKQGAPVFGVEMRIVDDNGTLLPNDGVTAGRLQVRGPAVLREYYKGAGGCILDGDGYFDTGDIATIDEHGFMQITDRAKDMIKSGGEWISSIELENAAAGYPGIREAAAIAVPDPKWGERPLLLVVPRDDATIDCAQLLVWLRSKIARWAVPDKALIVEELPHTAAGKLDKATLRKRFAVSNHS